MLIMKFKILFFYILFLIYFIHCNYFLKEKQKIQIGVVEITDDIPEVCNHVKGLKVDKVILADNEKELIQHYKITNLIYFKDELSPILYGSLYYMDFDNKIFCMALINKKIAIINNNLIENQDNMVQEICYPIKQCEVYDQKKFIYNILKN